MQQPTLFCFMVARSAEFPLVKLAVPHLLQCTGHGIYSNVTHHFQHGVYTRPVLKGSMDTPRCHDARKGCNMGAPNAEIFIPVWEHISHHVAYHDWIVKIDADSLFMVQQMQRVLASLPAGTARAPTLLVNRCTPGFDWKSGCTYGALIALSGPVVQRLRLAGNASMACKEETARGMAGGFGEDAWTSFCADRMGAQRVFVPNMLVPDSVADGRGFSKWDLLNDLASWQNSQPFCLSPFVSHQSLAPFAAFHPNKSPAQWQRCLRNVQRAWWLSDPTPRELAIACIISAMALAVSLVLAGRLCGRLSTVGSPV